MGDEQHKECELEIVREFLVDYVRSEYGTDEDGLRQFIADMRWLAKQRRAYEGVGRWAFFIVAGSVLTGVMVALWEGIKVLSRAHNGYP